MANQRHLQPASSTAGSDWQALGVGLMDTQEIMRIVANSTARIDLPMWLRSEPYLKVRIFSTRQHLS